MEKDKLQKQKPAELEQSKPSKLKDRREFVTGVATLGAAAVVGSAALAGKQGQVKSKILNRIQEQLSEADEGMAYHKGGYDEYTKGRIEIQNASAESS